MNILKAILLTLLFISIFAFVQVGIIISFKNLYFFYPTLFKNLYGISTILSFIISYSVIFYFFWKPKIIDFKKDILKPLSPKIIIYLLLIALGLELFDRILFDLEKIKDFYFEENIDYPTYYDINISTIYHAISAILIAPIFEELFFRKFILSKLLLQNNKTIALIISSLCFSIIHIETPNNLLPTFIFGLISGFIFIKTDKIIFCILLHFLMNTFWLGFLLYGENYYNWLYELNFNFLYWCLPLIGIILGLFGVYKITTIKTQ